MRKSVTILFLALITIACSDDGTVFDQESDLIGTWLLIEQYADPGDGSGVYRPVDSDKTVTFLDDNTFVVDGALCDLSIENDGSSNGTYQINEENLTAYSSENFLTPDNCVIEGQKVFIQFEGEYLILSFLCIEGCGQKYRKLR